MAEKTSVTVGNSEGYSLNIPAGWYVTVVFATQAAFKWRATISGGGKVYFDQELQTYNPQSPICASFRTEANANGLSLVIDVPQSQNLRVYSKDLTVTSDKNVPIAKTYTFIGEDGGDTDFKDVLLTITAWASAY
jgi:hypothetical protein